MHFIECSIPKDYVPTSLIPRRLQLFTGSFMNQLIEYIKSSLKNTNYFMKNLFFLLFMWEYAYYIIYKVGLAAQLFRYRLFCSVDYV